MTGPSRLGKDILVSIAGSLVPPLSVVLMAPLLARGLGVEGRGLLAGATAPYLLGVAVATVGLPEAITQQIASSSIVSRRILAGSGAVIVGAGLLATGMIIASIPFLSSSSGSLVLYVLVAAAALTPSLVVALLRGVAAGLGQWRRVAFERGITGGARILGTVALSASGHLTIFSATILIAYSPVLAGLVYVPLGRAHLRARVPIAHGRPGNPAFRRVFKYGLRMWIGTVAGILLVRLDQVLLGPLAGAYQLGLYVVAVNVGEVPLVAHSAIRDVMFTADSEEQRDERLAAAARISFVVSLAAGAALMASAWWWVPMLFGSEFRGAVPASIVVLVAVILGVPGSVAGAALGARGRPELRSYSLLAACIVYALLIVVLSPKYGAAGAAWATLVGNLISSNANIWLLVRRSSNGWSDFYAVRRADLRLLNQQTRTLARAVLRRTRPEEVTS